MNLNCIIADDTEIAEDECLILWASSRVEGNTQKSIKILSKDKSTHTINLSAQKFGFYDYESKNKNDDFLNISEKMLKAKIIVFATPVYWYAMCSQMKIFFDRLSDLITIRKKDGRALAGKSIYLLANGADETLPLGFEIPFQKTSKYFDMSYKGSHYLHTGSNSTLKKLSWDELGDFSQKIFSSISANSAVPTRALREALEE
jgi:multimeric flavodoxin WrbA